MLISIIIPAHNRESLLPKTLESVFAQRWRPVEVIVVDNCSNDATASVASEFSETHFVEGFTVKVISEAVPSPTKARNAGIARASGEAILFLDSDDVLTVSGLSELAGTLQNNPQIDFVYGKVAIADTNLSVTTTFEIGASTETLLEDPVAYDWHTMGALYRTELVHAVGGWDEDTKGADDWVFQARIKLKASSYRFVDAIVGLWRQHPGERLGTGEFRLEYTMDVVKACLAIHQLAKQAGVITPKTQRRLALRCLRHIWELGRFGAKGQRAQAISSLATISDGSPQLQLMTTIARFTPPTIDFLLHRMIENRNMVSKVNSVSA